MSILRWYVYILRCDDGSFYTGMTCQPHQRWEQHLSHLGSRYTSVHYVKHLAYMEEYESFDQARLRERQIKGWTRVKKQKLIRGEWGKWE